MRAKLLLGLIAILWIGMILAVGMESIIKFDTPSLTRAVAFDEGRVVFHFFNKVQFILLLSMLALIFSSEMGWTEKLVFLCVGLTLAVQVLWLFPVLSSHVDLIVAGINPPRTMDHAFYGWMDLAKVSLLSVLAFRLLTQFGK